MSPVTDQGDREAIAAWLASPAAAEALDAAGLAIDTHPTDPLAAGSLLRRRLPDLDTPQAAAALEQATLSRLAAQRYGIDRRLLLTRDGLEQGTRPDVADRRARMFAAAGARRVLDLTAGLGFDSAAFLAAGLLVTAVERDPVVARHLAHNCPDATVVLADATDGDVLAGLLDDLSPTDIVFVDPARRDPAGPRDAASARSRPERDPERWSPPWSYVQSLDHPRVAAKVAPGFAPPDDWEAQWVSVDRTVVECSLASWPLSGASRRAVVMTPTPPTVVDADPTLSCPRAETIGTWVHEPDPAVARAGAVPALAAQQGLALIDADSSWLTGETPSGSPALRSYLVLAELVGSPRQQRRQLADLEVSRLTVKSRDVAAEPRDVLRSLGVTEGPERVLVMTRRDGRSLSLLTQPAHRPPG
jgi:hypothetical protein